MEWRGSDQRRRARLMGKAEMNYRRRQIAPRHGTRERFELHVDRSRSAQQVDRGRTERAGKFPVGYFRQTVRSRKRLRGTSRHAGTEKRTVPIGVVPMPVATQMHELIAEEQQSEQKRKRSATAEFCRHGIHVHNVSWRCRLVNPVSPPVQHRPERMMPNSADRTISPMGESPPFHSLREPK